MVTVKTIPEEIELRLRPEVLNAMSADEFFMFCQDNPELRLERAASGEIIYMSPSGSTVSRLIAEILGDLILWNRSSKLGWVHDSSAGFTLPDGSVLSPDVSLVTHEQAGVIPKEAYDKFAPVVPVFVVEVVSPSDRLRDQQVKMEEWLKNGVQLGWLIDPNNQQAWVYEPNQDPVHVPSFDQTLLGGATLPNFSLDLDILK